MHSDQMERHIIQALNKIVEKEAVLIIIAFLLMVFINSKGQGQNIYYRIDLSNDDRKANIRGELFLDVDSAFTYYLKHDVGVISVCRGKWFQSGNEIKLIAKPHPQYDVIGKFEVVRVKKRIEDSLSQNKKYLMIYDEKGGDLFFGMTVKTGAKEDIFLGKPIELESNVAEIQLSFFGDHLKFEFDFNDKCNLYHIFVILEPKPNYQMTTYIPWDRLTIKGDTLMFHRTPVFQRGK